MCQAMTMAITIVLPDPVAIFEQIRRKLPPSEGISMPTRSDAGASVSQIRVSTASSWQKKNRRVSNSSGFRQCSSRRLVIPLTPGISRFAPRLHARADFVDQRNLNENTGVIERLRTLGGDHITSRPALAFDQSESALLPVVTPIPLRL